VTETLSTISVPFLDLRHSHEPLKDSLLGAFDQLIDSNAFINGPQVSAFERAWAGYCGVERCVGVASGLDALRLALIAGGIKRGDEVIVPAHTFVATFEAVSQAGGVPVPVDITMKDYNLDVAAVAAAVTPSTRFVMPVHLYGQLCDIRELSRVASGADVAVIEDACQAHGATRDGVGPGEATLAAAFSFYPGKNLGAMGDAGALVTNDAGLADRVIALREHGQRAKYRHELEGYTSRLDTIQAIVLLEKLERLDEWNDLRRAVAAEYQSRLAGVGDLSLPPVPEDSEPVWHLYVVRTASPVMLAEFLSSRGIGTGRHYPEPPHLSQAYRDLGYREGQFPNTERVAREGVSLPMFPGMDEKQVDAVVEAVTAYFENG
jgi:dTDP-3-amino-3,4,6-trideoxy-alpha-D-glucose transaminase